MSNNTAEYARAWRANLSPDHRARVLAGQRRAALKRVYGITPEQFDAMLEAQGGMCAICGTNKPGGNGRRFHVDHDHATGVVRGLLCHNCNRGLGWFGDDPTTVSVAAEYLRLKGRES